MVISKTPEQLEKMYTARQLIEIQKILDPYSDKLSGNKLYQATRCKSMAESIRRSIILTRKHL